MSPQAQAVAAAIAQRRFQPVTFPAASLSRVTKFHSGEPYWSQAKENRFDCPVSPPDPVYGVNYSAPSLATAFAESVLHEERHFDPSQSRWVVSDSGVLSARWVVELERPDKPELLLFPLFGDLLTALHIGNIVSAGNNYTVSREISKVIHDSAPELDGIAYVSNRANRTIAVATFQRSDVQVKQAPGAYVPLKSHPDYPEVLQQFQISVVA